jgi:aspartate/methionine/tyrosine aminotransferase
MLAQRTNLFSTSGTAKARSAAKAAAASGREIINLAAGEIWCDTPESVKAGAIHAIEQGINRYTDTIGLDELRQAIAQRLSAETGAAWAADEVAVTAGGKQALFNAAMAILDPGDEVLIPAPYWTTFPAQVRLAGATPVFVETPRQCLRTGDRGYPRRRDPRYTGDRRQHAGQSHRGGVRPGAPRCNRGPRDPTRPLGPLRRVLRPLCL